MKTRVLAWLCALMMAVGLICPAQGHELTGETPPSKIGYEDIAGDEWFADAVAEMTRRGLMRGVGGNRFAPHQEVNRATMVMVLWRLEGTPLVDMANPFPDTEEWYAGAANWAKSVGIADGYAGDDPSYPTGCFGGGDPLTREQFTVFLYKYARYKGTPIAEGMLGLYSDTSEVSDWVETAARHAVGMGILQGNGDNALLLRSVTDRGSLAVMLYRMLTPAAG